MHCIIASLHIVLYCRQCHWKELESSTKFMPMKLVFGLKQVVNRKIFFQNKTYDFVMQHTMQSPKHLKYCRHNPSMWYHNTESKQVSPVLCTTVSNHTIWNLWLNHLNCMSALVHHRSMMMVDILVNKAVLNRYLELKNPDPAIQPLVVLIPRYFF